MENPTFTELGGIRSMASDIKISTDRWNTIFHKVDTCTLKNCAYCAIRSGKDLDPQTDWQYPVK